MLEVGAALVVGIVVGAWGSWLTRRNEKKATAERLLVEALNDVVGGVSDVVSKVPGAQARFGSAMSRIGLYGSPELVRAFRLHQEDGTTITPEGRRLFMAALQQARVDLGYPTLDEDDLAAILFGAQPSLPAFASQSAPHAAGESGA